MQAEAFQLIDQSIPKPIDPTDRKDVSNQGLIQAYVLRNIAAQEAIELRQVKVKDLSERLARAKAYQSLGTLWKDASDRIRILRGRPLPGSLKPERKVKSKPKLPQGPVGPATE